MIREMIKEVLEKGLRLINFIDHYPEEREVLIKNISEFRRVVRRWRDDKMLGSMMIRECERMLSLIDHIEDETLRRDRRVSCRLQDIANSDLFRLSAAFLDDEHMEQLWQSLTGDLPKGSNNDWKHFISYR